MMAVPSSTDNEDTGAVTPRSVAPFVRPSSLGSQIASDLRREIVLGRLRGDTRLSQESLCSRYGTSRMPVRDALMRLVHEGLMMLTSGGHYKVADLTYEDVAEAFEIEALVHGRAAHRATLIASLDELDELEDLCDEMTLAEQTGDLEGLGTLQWRFHRKINLLARAPKLAAVSRTVSVGIPGGYLEAMPDWAQRANRVNRETVSWMKQREPTIAERIVRRLLEDSGSDLVQYLREGKLLPSRNDRVAR
jgi:DNA-binding GntR family transcriptional regulator